MLSSKCLSRATLRAPRTPQPCRNMTTRARPAQVRTATHPYAQRRQQHFVRSLATVTVLGATATAYQWANGNSILREVHAEEPPKEDEVELKFEEPRRRPKSADDNRNIISSQHLQVLKSWENPGVYTWGSNAGKVVAPDSDEKYIKTPRRISYFDGKLLRDIKLDRNFGAAIDEKGDLLQWGVAFSKDVTEPTKTLRGQKLTSLQFSRDRIIALSSGGTVYSIPVSQAEQKEGPKPASTSWIPFWSTSNNISYRTRTPENLGWTERVTDIASGLEHALMLTSSGRVFSFASGSQDFPTKGQLGIPGISFESRPAGPFDMPHEITTLKGFPIKRIAAGDYHSLVCDSEGRAFTFGDNTAGQLGFPFNAEATYVDAPSLLPTQKLYAGSASQAKVSNVFAGGNTSFLTIDATKSDQSRTTADTWAFGFGLTGQLGVGRWIHTCADPVKVPAFSGLFEWDEKAHKAIPIRLNTISVGATHAAAVMDNVASVLVSDRTRASKLTDNDTNWGRDILFWGNNEFYQIGSGKRSNVATPTYIQPLDQSAELERAAGVTGIKAMREKEMHRFQITPRQKVRVNGRMVEFEQKVECGRGCTAVYSAV